MKNLNAKFILKVAGTLTAISLVVAALLGVVNMVTEDRIAELNFAATKAALAQVAPEGAEFQAVELTERNVIVLPTKSVPMGISAALAFDPALSPEENEAAMKEAAEAVHTASITYAVRDTNYDGQEIHEHDIMGMLDNKLTVLGHDIAQVARDITEKMVSEDSSLVTIYYGQDVQEADAQALCDSLAEIYPDCDVELQRGGQPLYYYLIAVE